MDTRRIHDFSSAPFLPFWNDDKKKVNTSCAVAITQGGSVWLHAGLLERMKEMKGKNGRQLRRETERWVIESAATNLLFMCCIILDCFPKATGWAPPHHHHHHPSWGLPTHLSGWMSVQFPRLSHQRLLQIQETAECLWQIPGEQSDLMAGG